MESARLRVFRANCRRDRQFEAVLERSPPTPAVQLRAIRASLVRCRDRFHAVPIHRDASMPLIGVVGEIFCRLNTFSNDNLVAALEQYGAEAWLSDIVEWIRYTNSEHFRKLKLEGRLWTLEALGAWVRKRVQKHDEHVLVDVFKDDFVGREEPDIYEVLECARPYLPREGASGAGGVLAGAAGAASGVSTRVARSICCWPAKGSFRPQPARRRAEVRSAILRSVCCIIFVHLS